MSAATTTTAPARIDAALAVLRLAVGAIFIAHGAQKLFVFGPAGVGAGFTQMGIPMGGLVGPLVGGVEFLGGIAIVLGLLTRLAASGVAITMLGAIFLVHLKNGFFAPNGIEFPLSLLAAALALVLAGAGRWSVDAQLRARRADHDATGIHRGTRRAA